MRSGAGKAGATALSLVSGALGVAVLFAAVDARAQCWPPRLDAELLDVDENVQDYFGDAMALEGNLLAIGAPGVSAAGAYTGSAYAYERVGGTWQAPTLLLGDDAGGNEYHGYCVAADADTMTVVSGAPWQGGSYQGAAYVFVKGADTWYQDAKLTASTAQQGDILGSSVAIEGRTIVVGAPLANFVVQNSGAAFVYERAGGVWTEQQYITANDMMTNDGFGYSVDIDGDVIAVAASTDEMGVDSGSVYVFRKLGPFWLLEQKLVPAAPTGFQQGENSVAIDGDTIVFGTGHDDDGGMDAGAVHVWRFVGGTWIQEAKLVASDPRAEAYFGWTVEIQGDYVVVGAYQDDDPTTGPGSAYVFRRIGSTWSELGKIVNPGGEAGAWFGGTVAIDGTTLSVGASGTDAAARDAGAAYVFCIERTETRCADSLDDDGDLAIDCADSDCRAIPPCEDADGDGVRDSVDCAPTDGGSFAVPVEVPLLLVTKPAPLDSRLEWVDVSGSSGTGTVGDVATGSILDMVRDRGLASSACLAEDLAATTLDDGRPATALGDGWWYLVRAVNTCGAGPWGDDSRGGTRTFGTAGCN